MTFHRMTFLRMRFGGFGGDDNLGPVPGGLQGHGEPDPAATARDVKHLAREFPEIEEYFG